MDYVYIEMRTTIYVMQETRRLYTPFLHWIKFRIDCHGVAT